MKPGQQKHDEQLEQVSIFVSLKQMKIKKVFIFTLTSQQRFISSFHVFLASYSGILLFITIRLIFHLMG